LPSASRTEPQAAFKHSKSKIITFLRHGQVVCVAQDDVTYSCPPFAENDFYFFSILVYCRETTMLQSLSPASRGKRQASKTPALVCDSCIACVCSCVLCRRWRSGLLLRHMMLLMVLQISWTLSSRLKDARRRRRSAIGRQQICMTPRPCSCLLCEIWRAFFCNFVQ
jgi:hypothetical protein